MALGGYPDGLHICTPVTGESRYTFFFEGNDLLLHSSALKRFFAAHDFRPEPTSDSLLGPNEAADVSAALSGERAFEVRFRSKNSKTLVGVRIGTIDGGAWSPLSVHVIDCSKPGNPPEAALCAHR